MGGYRSLSAITMPGAAATLLDEEPPLPEQPISGVCSALCEHLLGEVREVITHTINDHHLLPPSACLLMVGAHPAAVCYAGCTIAAARAAGVALRVQRFPEDTPKSELLAVIQRLNNDTSVHGAPSPPDPFPCLSHARPVHDIRDTRDTHDMHDTPREGWSGACAPRRILVEASHFAHRASGPGSAPGCLRLSPLPGSRAFRTRAGAALDASERRCSYGAFRCVPMRSAAAGIMLQLPCPPQLDAGALLAAVSDDKDVDCLKESSVRRCLLRTEPTVGPVRATAGREGTRRLASRDPCVRRTRSADSGRSCALPAASGPCRFGPLSLPAASAAPPRPLAAAHSFVACVARAVHRRCLRGDPSLTRSAANRKAPRG